MVRSLASDLRLQLGTWEKLKALFGLESVERQYVILSLQNTPYCLEEQDTLFRLQQSIRCLDRRFDTSYPTGGYAVSSGVPEQSTLENN
ncbi:hypothetical protein Tco_0690015 [Tanacetum coccineum]